MRKVVFGMALAAADTASARTSAAASLHADDTTLKLSTLRRPTFLVVALALLLGPVETAPASGAKAPPLYKNCTNLNRKYEHGLGRAGAHDRTTGTLPVTNFTRSTRLYRLAM